MNGHQEVDTVEQYGTNAERIAYNTSALRPGAEWYETDTTARYKWFGTWVQTAATNGAAPGYGSSGGSLGAVYTNQQRATATAAPLAARPLKNGVTVTAYLGNAGNIMVGGPALTNVIDGTGNGEVLQPGVPRSFAADDASRVYIILAAGNTSATDFVTISGN